MEPENEIEIETNSETVEEVAAETAPEHVDDAIDETVTEAVDEFIEESGTESVEAEPNESVEEAETMEGAEAVQKQARPLSELVALVEALIFVADEPVTIKLLADGRNEDKGSGDAAVRHLPPE
jgi:hypothetical protein